MADLAEIPILLLMERKWFLKISSKLYRYPRHRCSRQINFNWRCQFYAGIIEFVWKTFRLKGHTPLFKAMINILAFAFITSDAKA